MNTDNTTDRVIHMVALALATIICAPFSMAGSIAEDAGQAFKNLAADTSITRSMPLSSLGFNGPVVLAAGNAQREFYLPVPADTVVSEAVFALKANYMRADGGHTTMVVSLDNFPVSARAFLLENGSADIVLGVDNSPRKNGFVRLGINWSTLPATQTACADSHAPGNILRIEPTSVFSYRYDGAAIHDLRTAWHALPAAPSILVAPGTLSADSYDTAWRLGAILERAGKHSVIKALPAVGDVVDLSNITIPAGLRRIPAFAALAAADKHQLQNPAELGALLSLGQHAWIRADILVADQALTSAMTAAFDALGRQIDTLGPDAVRAFAAWRGRIDPNEQASEREQVRLVQAFGAPAILVGQGMGAKAAAMFGEIWGSIAATSTMTLRTVNMPHGSGAFLYLKNINGAADSIDVQERSDWTSTFDLLNVAAGGLLPKTLVLDVAAAPGATQTAPVAAVFLNDLLLGARHLDANGRSERIETRIPRRILTAHNTIRVSFMRQQVSDHCRETPTAYPVSILPSSHLVLTKSKQDADFTGLARRFATGADLLLPRRYLAEASSSLPRVIAMVVSTGISPVNARLEVVDDAQPGTPHNHFLALDAPIKEVEDLAGVTDGALVVTNQAKHTILDIAGLNRVGILEIVRNAAYYGIVYRTIGKAPPMLNKPFALAHGNFSVIDSNGVLLETNKDGVSDADVIDEQDVFSSRDVIWWGLPVAMLILFVAVLAVAAVVRRRRAARRNSP